MHGQVQQHSSFGLIAGMRVAALAMLTNKACIGERLWQYRESRVRDDGALSEGAAEYGATGHAAWAGIEVLVWVSALWRST